MDNKFVKKKKTIKKKALQGFLIHYFISSTTFSAMILCPEGTMCTPSGA